MLMINLINLKYFHDAVKLGSVTAAAKSNFVTQSAISQGISKLEKSLGVILIAHHPNRFRLTPDGEMAFKEAKELLKRTAEFKENLTKNNIGNLEFACTYSFAVAIIPEFLKKFKNTYSDTTVNFYLGKNGDIRHMLKTGLIDFGIGPDEGDLEGFEKIEIYQGKFGLYAAAQMQKKELSLLGFILAESNCTDTIAFKDTFYKKFGKPPQIAFEVNSWEVIANLAIEGLGIGFFPDFIAFKKKKYLKKFNLQLPSFPYKIYAFFPKGMRLRKSSEIFLSYFI